VDENIPPVKEAAATSPAKAISSYHVLMVVFDVSPYAGRDARRYEHLIGQSVVAEAAGDLRGSVSKFEVFAQDSMRAQVVS
jgi:hypothetical protein